VGFVLLYFGAEWLVKGSSSLARSLGVTPIVIGLTVVAFGTSAPELVVSLISSIQGKSMIAVGNVVGSNWCSAYRPFSIPSKATRPSFGATYRSCWAYLFTSWY
jgi:Ca2+/Na+ antiporter